MKINLVPLEVKDEILNGEAKYNIYDENGKLLYENCFIELNTNILQIGTALNKVFFDKIESNLDAIISRENGESFKQYIFEGTYGGLKTPDLLDYTFEIKETDEKKQDSNISSIQSEISSLKTRMTAAEKNISALS